MAEEISTRQGYANALVFLGKEKKDLVVVDADLSKSTRTEVFAKNHPERFFNVGVAEQDLIGTASGLAISGKTVFASTFAMFATGRAWEQIRNTVCFDELDVKIIATHGGISVGPDGSSHQAIEDIAIMRALPKMRVIVPSDAISTEKLIIKASQTKGPFYIRLGRANVPVLTDKAADVEIGKGIVLREGSDILIVACGVMVFEALKAADILKEKNISVGVIDMHTIKPLDTQLLDKFSKRYKKMVTIEEHSIVGGLGGAVAEYLSETDFFKPFLRLGINDRFGQSGEMEILLEKYKLNAQGIAHSLIEWRRLPVEK